MKAFVTGGTGFIGQRLVRALVDRGYEVVALARSEAGDQTLASAGATAVRGDITDVASMREPMRGSDVVFHLAAWYGIGKSDPAIVERINVGGTRKVLRLAHELGVPKIVYTSTVAVFGDTGGRLVDEAFYAPGPFLSEYDRTKWLAHYEVALPLIEKGAPIIIVMPGGVYGPGDTSVLSDMMRAFYRGEVPIIPGPETTLTYAHVDDIVEGHILAAEKGKAGESYILAGPAVPLGEMVDFWAQLTGRRAPLLRLSAEYLRPFAPLVTAVESAAGLPAMYSGESVNSLGATYMARADKARAELGWQPRSLHEGLAETFDHIAATTTPLAVSYEERLAQAAAIAAVILMLLFWRGRRSRRAPG